MPESSLPPTNKIETSLRRETAGSLHRNVVAASLTSFLADISSEMVHNVIPLLLANVLGARTVVIGLIEGIAETTASLVKVISGSVSDRLAHRKWLAVLGYAVSALAKPAYYFAGTWSAVAGVRWIERTGKGIRTAPRDALLADSVDRTRRGFAFGIHRAADTAGATIGLVIAVLVVDAMQGGAVELGRGTFRTLVLVSLVPATLAVVALALIARDVVAPTRGPTHRIGLRGLGRRFWTFLAIVTTFNLGNFSDAFLVLRAQERGMGVTDILWMLVAFNLVYASLSAPAGHLSDRLGRRQILITGWIVFAVTFLGFALAESSWAIAVCYLAYGAFYALSTGTATAMVADLVPVDLRGTAYGTYHAVVGLVHLPASLLAGILWQGLGSWSGLGASAPFFLASATAVTAATLLALTDDGGGASRPRMP